MTTDCSLRLRNLRMFSQVKIMILYIYIYIYIYIYVVQQPYEGKGTSQLLTSGFTYQKTKVNNHTINQDDSLDVAEFLEWNYCYKSVVSQIIHSLGRGLMPHTCKKKISSSPGIKSALSIVYVQSTLPYSVCTFYEIKHNQIQRTQKRFYISEREIKIC